MGWRGSIDWIAETGFQHLSVQKSNNLHLLERIYWFKLEVLGLVVDTKPVCVLGGWLLVCFVPIRGWGLKK